MEGIKQLNIENERYYFYDDIMNIKKFPIKLIKNR